MQRYGIVRTRLALSIIAALLAGGAFAQTPSLTLSAVPGTGPASFSVSASIPSDSNVALLQWQLTFPSDSIASLAVTAGPALTAAGKNITCNASTGTYSCIAYGLNANPIASGVVANVTATFASGASTGNVTLGSALGATADGEPFSFSSPTAGVGVSAPVAVTALTCASTSLNPGATTSCTVSLSASVTADTTVALSTNSSALTVPASVVVPAGASSASFNVTAASFSSSQTASLSAALNGATQSVSLSLVAPSLTSFQCAATGLAANTTTTCTIGLSAAAPSAGALISLSSNSSGVSTPASVTVAAGATSVSFTATATLQVLQNTAVTLTASMGAQSLSTSLTIVGLNTVMSLWSPSAVPNVPWVATAGPLTVGLRFRSDVSGAVTGVRFYKASSNSGTHIGLLYSSTGTLLAKATFTGETASGWQQVNFSAPVPVTANTVYVIALYTTSGCAYDTGYFAAKGVDNGYLHAPQSTSTAGNGVYAYGSGATFPSLTLNGANYWVDVAFTVTTSGATGAPPSTIPSGADTLWSASATPVVPWVPTAGPLTVGLRFYSDTAGTVTGARFYKGVGSGTGHQIGLLYSSTGQLLAQATFTNETASGWQQVNFATPVPIAAKTTYVIALFTDSGCAYDAGYFTGKGVDNAPLHAPSSSSAGGNGVYVYGNAPAFPSMTFNNANYWVDVAFTAASGATTTNPPASPSPTPGSITDTLWSASAEPAVPWVPTAGPLTVGLRFYSDTAGTVTGARFYKGLGSGSGNHVGLLYSSTGQLLAQATFTNETASGWQQANFAAPVSIAANTTYVIALYTDSGCAYDAGYFTAKGVDSAPLHAPASSSASGNGVYVYGNAPAFPSMTVNNANYWVDLAFTPASVP